MRPYILALLLTLPLGCTTVTEPEEGLDDATTLDDGKGDSPAGSVDRAMRASCSTAGVRGLARQVVDEMNCMTPGALSDFSSSSHLTYNDDEVFPFLAAEAVDSLVAVALEAGTIELTSGYRTLVQQWVIHRWREQRRCGIAAAAEVGDSEHENARAIDVRNYYDVRTLLKTAGWSQPMSRDPVHFQYNDAPDLGGLDVHAFQRLWNRNNPEDQIAEDGDYGPATQARLQRSPATGFATGAQCE